jgi:hypothetical protein
MEKLFSQLNESQTVGELETVYKLMVRHMNKFVINPKVAPVATVPGKGA